MKKKIIAVFVLLLAIDVFGSGIREDHVYEVEQPFGDIEHDIPYPDFLTEDSYVLNIGEFDKNQKYYEFILKEEASRRGSGINILEKIETIIPLETTMEQIISDYNLPPSVIITPRMELSSSGVIFAVSFLFEGVQLYFDVPPNPSIDGRFPKVLSIIFYSSPSDHRYKDLIYVGMEFKEFLDLYIPENLSKTVQSQSYEFEENGEVYQLYNFRSENIRVYVKDNKIESFMIYNGTKDPY